MSKEFGSGVGMTAAPTTTAGRVAGGPSVPGGTSASHSVETSFSHTIPAPAHSTESIVKAPTITHKFGTENTRNITFGKPISQDTFHGNESIRGLKIIAKNNGEPAKKPSESNNFNRPLESAAMKHEKQPTSTKVELRKYYADFKPTPDYFQPDMYKRESHKGLELATTGKTVQDSERKNNGAEDPGKTQTTLSQEAQRLSKVVEEQGIHLNVEQITKESQDQQKKDSNSTAKHSENSQSLMQEYISEYIKPNTSVAEHDAPVSSSRKNALTQAESVSRTDGKIKRDGKIAAQEFNKDVEQAKRVNEAFDAYLQSVGSDSPALQEEGRKLSLRALDQQLQRNGVKEAVMTAYSTGKEKSTTQPEDIADILEHQQVEEEEKAATKTELQTISGIQQEKDLSEEESLQVESEEQIETLQEIETEFSEEASSQEILDDTLEEPEYVLERDKKANEMRKAYAMSAAQVIFSANGQQPINGPQIVSLMPHDDLQPQEVKSQIIQELLRDDGSYKDVLSTISSVNEMDSLHEVRSVVDTAVENNTAVKVVEVEQKSAPEATEQEKEKVLDESIRPTRKVPQQTRSSY